MDDGEAATHKRCETPKSREIYAMSACRCHRRIETNRFVARGERQMASTRKSLAGGDG